MEKQDLDSSFDISFNSKFSENQEFFYWRPLFVENWNAQNLHCHQWLENSDGANTNNSKTHEKNKALKNKEKTEINCQNKKVLGKHWKLIFYEPE